ncbi:hypothetical protein GCK72_011493 [Caenorhabditis remanei]|uniref:Uncharacterized protein n=1 Tax=Caenorhabditis remanei TaxID=31234 RepID=A0A6A5H7R7_CAERE|nr:hypothetical protein GCK72_011493 [Caenorhabditis remanei]KAF1763227.1 hypothetical protein GCK72_011493 [Caenorhabditis remanei]
MICAATRLVSLFRSSKALLTIGIMRANDGASIRLTVPEPSDSAYPTLQSVSPQYSSPSPYYQYIEPTFPTTPPIPVVCYHPLPASHRTFAPKVGGAYSYTRLRDDESSRQRRFGAHFDTRHSDRTVRREQRFE